MTMEVAQFFEHAGLHGCQAYLIRTSDTHTALLHAGMAFGRDVLIACMGEGLQVQPKDVVLRHVNLHLEEDP